MQVTIKFDTEEVFVLPKYIEPINDFLLGKITAAEAVQKMPDQFTAYELDSPEAVQAFFSMIGVQCVAGAVRGRKGATIEIVESGNKEQLTA